jgi:hypothetical protein
VQPAAPSRAQALLPDVRRAKDRPPVVLVVREGDPSSAIAIAVTTGGLEGNEDDPEVAVGSRRSSCRRGRAFAQRCSWHRPTPRRLPPMPRARR